MSFLIIFLTNWPVDKSHSGKRNSQSAKISNTIQFYNLPITNVSLNRWNFIHWHSFLYRQGLKGFNFISWKLFSSFTLFLAFLSWQDDEKSSYRVFLKSVVFHFKLREFRLQSYVYWFFTARRSRVAKDGKRAYAVFCRIWLYFTKPNVDAHLLVVMMPRR